MLTTCSVWIESGCELPRWLYFAATFCYKGCVTNLFACALRAALVRHERLDVKTGRQTSALRRRFAGNRVRRNLVHRGVVLAVL